MLDTRWWGPFGRAYDIGVLGEAVGESISLRGWAAGVRGLL